MSDEARRAAAGGAAPATLRASSEDRKSPGAAGTGAGSPPPMGHKIQLKSADMKEEMRQEAFDIARAAFEKHTMEKDIAEYIKKEFDKNHGPTWHCIVGRNFANANTLACLLPIALMYAISESSAAKGGSLEFVSMHADV